MTVAPLNTFGTRAVWEWVSMIGAQSFTGEVRLATDPIISLYALRGETYWAEQASDPAIADRLISVGALQAAQLERGAVRLGDTVNLSRLFERDQTVDRHVAEVAVELMRDDLLERVAMQPTEVVAVAPLRVHPSGIQRWFAGAGATAAGFTPSADSEPTTAQPAAVQPATAAPVATPPVAAAPVATAPVATAPVAAPPVAAAPPAPVDQPAAPAGQPAAQPAAAVAQPAVPNVQFDFDRAFAPLADLATPRLAPVKLPQRSETPAVAVDPTPSQQVPIFTAAPIPLTPTVAPTSLTELWTMADTVIPGGADAVGTDKDPNNG